VREKPILHLVAVVIIGAMYALLYVCGPLWLQCLLFVGLLIAVCRE